MIIGEFTSNNDFDWPIARIAKTPIDATSDNSKYAKLWLRVLSNANSKSSIFDKLFNIELICD